MVPIDQGCPTLGGCGAHVLQPHHSKPQAPWLDKYPTTTTAVPCTHVTPDSLSALYFPKPWGRGKNSNQRRKGEPQARGCSCSQNNKGSSSWARAQGPHLNPLQDTCGLWTTLPYPLTGAAVVKHLPYIWTSGAVSLKQITWLSQFHSMQTLWTFFAHK